VARIRTIKPEFWKHEDLSDLPEATHMLAGALLNMADDEGYFNAKPALVKAECSPLREPSVSIQDSLGALAKIGYLQFFAGSDGKRYGRVVKFDDHQRVNRPTPSKIKPLCNLTEPSVSPHAQLSEASPPERKGKEGKGTGKGKEISPTAQETPPASPGQLVLAVDNTRTPQSEVSKEDRIVDLVLKLYHELLPACRKVAVKNPKLRKKILAGDKLAVKTIRELGLKVTHSEFWEAFFGECQDDDWLRGDRPNPHNPKWKQNLGTLLEEERFAEITNRAIARPRDEESAA
jgi:hypothetical protein